MRWRSVAVMGAIALVGVGCTGETDDSEPVVPADRCPSGEVPIGLTRCMPCPPGERLLDDGSCQAAGVPEDGCTAGFVHDGDHGCEAVLPAEDCPPGMMATPGQTECHTLTECGDGLWGEIPIDSSTEHVDLSYSGGDSDGSAARPWTSVQQGVDAAAPGAIVALAEGSYHEDVLIEGKAVRLWGRCPQLTEIAGGITELATVQVLSGGDGTELRGLAIVGDSIGALLVSTVAVRHLWIHDNAWRGLNVEAALGPATVTVSDSLIEGNGGVGVYVSGADMSMDSAVIRNTEPDASGNGGRGFSARPNGTSGLAPTLSFSSCLLEGNREIGLLAAGSTTSVQSVVIQDTQLNTQGLDGRGISAQRGPNDEASELVFSGVLVERNHSIGIFASGSTGSFESVVVRDTRANALGLGGRGIVVQNEDPGGEPSVLSVHSSLVDRNLEVGIFLSSSDVVLQSVRVRDTGVNGEGSAGRGVSAEVDVDRLQPSLIVLEQLVIENSREMGIASLGMDAHIEGCWVRNTTANDFGSFGDGVMFASWSMPAHGTIKNTRVEASARAAVSVFGAEVGVESSELICQAFDLDAETYGGMAANPQDLGDNLCSCQGQDKTCAAVSAGLEPPAPLDPSEG